MNDEEMQARLKSVDNVRRKVLRLLDEEKIDMELGFNELVNVLAYLCTQSTNPAMTYGAASITLGMIIGQSGIVHGEDFNVSKSFN